LAQLQQHLDEFCDFEAQQHAQLAETMLPTRHRDEQLLKLAHGYVCEAACVQRGIPIPSTCTDVMRTAVALLAFQTHFGTDHYQQQEHLANEYGASHVGQAWKQTMSFLHPHPALDVHRTTFPSTSQQQTTMWAAQLQHHIDSCSPTKVSYTMQCGIVHALHDTRCAQPPTRACASVRLPGLTAIIMDFCRSALYARKALLLPTYIACQWHPFHTLQSCVPTPLVRTKRNVQR
jgi:hypothetical protein